MEDGNHRDAVWRVVTVDAVWRVVAVEAVWRVGTVERLCGGW